LSKLKGTFAYNPKPLTLHRIHEESTTSELINDNSRTEEDLAMFKKFWPGFMARFIMKFYSGSQDSNKQ
ncbi:MAG: glycosyltransferase family 2 protein, partial [Parasporobacterium sp.]|nr:glycosyltransferase family 2 protein [Parasporobacterium sp.]